MLLFCLTLNVGFTTESAEVDNTWSRQDNYILCTHIKMEKIQQNYIWKCISTVSHDKSSRNKERCGVNASCMLYSFKIVSPMRQGLLTSALSATNTTFNAREANIAVNAVNEGEQVLWHLTITYIYRLSYVIFTTVSRLTLTNLSNHITNNTSSSIIVKGESF